MRLFGQMDAEDSPLRAIVGRKLMLEYDIGSARDGERAHPAMFLRPGERPIIGARNQVNDVATVVDALVSCAGWERDDAERKNVERAYLAQPEDTRMDSFGVFPSRTRSNPPGDHGLQDTAGTALLPGGHGLGRAGSRLSTR